MIYMWSIHAQFRFNPCPIHATVQSKTKKWWESDQSNWNMMSLPGGPFNLCEIQCKTNHSHVWTTHPQLNGLIMIKTFLFFLALIRLCRGQVLCLHSDCWVLATKSVPIFSHTHTKRINLSRGQPLYCSVPARWGLQKTTLAPGSDETRARDPQRKIEKPWTDYFTLGEPGTSQY